ncbi:MAG: threonine synthase [Anaerolineales bacterium]|nr:threonine synthase [Anaerolineales bacterium]
MTIPPHFLGYRCSLCGETFDRDYAGYVCPAHGDLGNLDVELDYAAIGAAVSPRALPAEASLWRYLPLLPVGDPGFVGTPLRAAGGTPLYRATRLGAALGLTNLWLKDDGRNPTASFKDRASAVVVARAREIGAGVPRGLERVVVTASTGNAGAALAGMAGAVGQPVVIFAPETAPPAKVAQLLIFGARVLLVRGNYDQAFDLSLAAAREFGWYVRNTGYNAFTAEGKKTAAFEMCEQLTAATNAPGPGWAAPDVVFVSVGDGNILSGLHKGLVDLAALGWINRVPRLIGVQAEGSAACARAWADGCETIAPVSANTLADSINVDLPRDGLRAVRAVRTTRGAFVTVSDEAILEAIAALGRDAAVFAEPAGAAAYAGLVQAAQRGLVRANETIVVVNTGSGLKDVKAARQAAGRPQVIDLSLEAVRRALV